MIHYFFSLIWQKSGMVLLSWRHLVPYSQWWSFWYSFALIIILSNFGSCKLFVCWQLFLNYQGKKLCMMVFINFVFTIMWQFRCAIIIFFTKKERKRKWISNFFCSLKNGQVFEKNSMHFYFVFCNRIVVYV